MTIAQTHYDVAIVGAGPAGSSAAIRLATAGLQVLIVEQKQFPREKLCGEFISPECLPHFVELGVFDHMKAAGGTGIERTVFFAQNGGSLSVPNNWFMPGSLGLGLSRAAMDNALLDRARQVGVDVLENTFAAGLVVESGSVRGVELRDHDRTRFQVGSEITIDATGRTRALVRHIENRSELRNRAQFVAFKTHLTAAAIPAGDCEIYSYRGGYGGCNGVENSNYNLCFIVTAENAKRFNSDPTQILRNVVFANSRAKMTLGEAHIDNEWLAVPIEGYGRASLAPATGLLTVGDAAAFIDPFTGSGILLALESSKIASNNIAAAFSASASGDRFPALAAEYASSYAAAFSKRLRICSVLRRAAFVPFLSEIMIKGLSLNDAFARRLARATRQ